MSGCDYYVTCDYRLAQQGWRLREQHVLAEEAVNPVDVLREV
jgi:hypothetical protein